MFTGTKALSARVEGVNGFGNEFLAGTAFAADEDGGARRRDLCHQVEQDMHFVALANDAGKIEALLQGALELHVLIAQATGLNGLRHLREQLVVGPRLGDVVHRAVLERGARHLNGTERGDQNHGKLRITPADFFQHVQAIAVRQAYVEQKKIKRMFFELGEAGFSGFGAGDAIAFAPEQELKTLADFGFVVNYEDGALRHGPLS